MWIVFALWVCFRPDGLQLGFGNSWHDYVEFGREYEIKACAFSTTCQCEAEGTCGPFLINKHTSLNDGIYRITGIYGDGNFATVSPSPLFADPPNSEACGYAVNLRFHPSDRVFNDGFEGGDPLRWSSCNGCGLMIEPPDLREQQQ